MNNVPWFGRVFFVSMATCATLARAEAAAVQSEPSGATRAPLVVDREVRTSVTLEGFVLAPDGSPAEGARVTSSAGGSALTDAAGSYRLEVELPLEATSVQVTAVSRAGANLIASTSVAVSAATPSTRLPPLAISRRASCSPSWVPTFGGRPGTDGPVLASAVFDDGNGPALYVGGGFITAGGVPARHIAKWDGSSWSALGSGVDEPIGKCDSCDPAVYALAVFDDGSGAALYAGGDFVLAGGIAARGIAKWDGSSWAAVGNGLDDVVLALTVYDDGGGPALYAGGEFSTLSKWNGSGWSTLGGAMNGSVYALEVYDDGGGSALYAGGDFTTVGGVPANHLAKWNGSSWSALGSEVNDDVFALKQYDDGGGPALYAGGYFTSAGGVAANRIARWDGASWSALGSGMDAIVETLAVHDDGGGPALYAAGYFTTAGGVTANAIARWDSSSWSALASGVNAFVYTLASYDGSGGPALFAGGYGANNSIAQWDGSKWSFLGTGMNHFVNALMAFDDGSGPALYAGGFFTEAGGVRANRIAKWDGSSWSPLDTGVDDGGVAALAVYDDGGGPALYAGGQFVTPSQRIAKWDGSSWSGLAGGVSGGRGGPPWVVALAVHDDGGGPALYAGGNFTNAGGVPARFIAKWNGTNWSALGSGINGGSGINVWVLALAVFDDGSGPALYAAGSFATAGGVSAHNIAKWDGSSWSPLGSGTNGIVNTLAVYDDGSGSALYAGGGFLTAGGVAASRIAKWDGTSWSAVGGGIDDYSVTALAVHDDGSGPALYAGGGFPSAGGVAVNNIAKWDGTSWSALGSGMYGSVSALAVHDDGGGPALYAGGRFASVLDSGDSYLAKWGCADTTRPVLTCPSSITVVDRFADGPGEVVTFTVTATDDLDPAPVIECAPPSGSTFPPGTTLVHCTATDASGKRSTCEFPVTVVRKADRR